MIRLRGFLRLQIRRPDGRIRYDTGFFPNMLLLSGLNEMGTRASWLTHCQVGTDSSAPANTQTSMLGHIAGTSNIIANITGQASTPPYYGWRRLTYRFAAGTVAANLSEAGAGWDVSGSTLISRALIIDPITQLPTTITPLADELLDVTYELRYYAPTVDVNGSATFNGVNYDTLTRACIATDAVWSSGIGTMMGVEDDSGWAYDGAIGTVLTSPAGGAAQATGASYSNAGYSNGAYNRDFSIAVGPTEWNLGAGIRTVRIETTAGCLQTQFTANPGGTTIPKDSNFLLNMTWNLAWSAY